MIGRIIGALVGAEVERKKGDSPLKGAVLGMVATRVLGRMGPLGLVLGGAYVAKKAYDRRRAERAGRT